VKFVKSDTVQRLGRSLYWWHHSHCCNVTVILSKCWLIHLKHIPSLTDMVHYILIFKIFNSIPYFSSEYFRDVRTLKKPVRPNFKCLSVQFFIQPLKVFSFVPGFRFCSALSTELFHLDHRINNELFGLVIHCKNNNERVANSSRYITKSIKQRTAHLRYWFWSFPWNSVTYSVPWGQTAFMHFISRFHIIKRRPGRKSDSMVT
jgi:hypothetical protein